MKRISFLILVLVVLSSAQSSHDIDLQFFTIRNGKKSETTKENGFTAGLLLRYSSKIAFNENLSLLVSEEADVLANSLRNSYANALIGEINHPTSALTSLGLEYRAFGRLQASVRSQIFSNNLPFLLDSKPIKFPVNHETNSKFIGAEMTQRYRNSIDFFWEIPWNRFAAAVNLIYDDLNYDYEQNEVFAQDYHESDLWGQGSVGYSFFDGNLWTRGTFLFKDDLNEYNGYNLIKAAGGIESNFRLYKRRIRGFTRAMVRYYECAMMNYGANRTYADKAGLLSYSRISYSIKPRVILKTDINLEVAKELFSQRYELAFRNVWKNLSWVEPGYWITMGTLEPRHSFYCKSTINLGQHFSVAPDIRGYFKWFDEKEQFNYYRTDVGFAVDYNIKSEKNVFLKNSAFNIGGNYRWFKNPPKNIEPVFMSTLRIYAGFKSYL